MQALDFAHRQWRHFADHDALRPQIHQTCWSLAQGEALARVLKQSGRPPEKLFAWSVYGSAVRSFKRWASDRHKLAVDKLAGLKRKSQQRADAAEEAALLASVEMAAERELAWLEEDLIKEFWAQYEEAAALWVSGALRDRALEPAVRAFLRYGLIGGAPWFLPADLAQALLRECAAPLTEWDPSCGATHVFYADEYLAHVARGRITPSMDEDMELTRRGTAQWKRDKAWRRVVHGPWRLAALEQTLRRVRDQVGALEERITTAEQRARTGDFRSPEYQATRLRNREEARQGRVEVARLRRAADNLRDRILPAERQWNAEAVQRLHQLGAPPGADELVRHEARQVRRLCRLTARLKDRFPPFSLAESYAPGTPAVHPREAVREEMAQIEILDTTIFKEALSYARKPNGRVYMRQSPYILIAPGRGFLALSCNPRGRSEVGRLVIPAYAPRPGLLKQLIAVACADFRWDTSRESAGLDVLTSDTLVAAYGSVRWECRKLPRAVRERVGFGKGSDRTNWRGHYLAYLASALEGGKKLCFRCPEVYAVVLKYIGLPPGVKPFR
jgi:hypothetical protein